MIEIRLASFTELLQLSLLFKVVYIETYGLEGVSQEFADFTDSQFSIEELQSKVASKDSKIWVAEFKGNLVGALHLEKLRANPINQHQGPEINKLYVLKNFYGQGIGQALLKEAEDYLRKTERFKVWLWTLSSNERAVKFYQRSGYKDIGRAFFQMAVNKYENTVMTKDL